MSLRRELITRIALALIAGGALTALLGGLFMRHEVDELLDQELAQITRIASQIQTVNHDTVPAEHWRQGSRENVVIVQRWYGDERVSLVPTRLELPKPDAAGYRDIQLRGHRWRAYALRTADGWVVSAQPIEARLELMHGAYWMAGAPVLLGLPLAGILVVLVIRRTLAPLRRLVAEVQRRPALASTPLRTTDIPDEVSPLVHAFNELLGRVNASVERERNFVTDAAHALRTPVTALLLQAQSLQEARSPADARERLEDLTAGIARAHRTVQQLLDLARSEAATRGHASVCEALRALPGELQPLLDAKGITLIAKVADDDDATIPIHSAVLQLAIRSVLENAIRYSPTGSTITLGAFTREGQCRVWISDQGPGLPEEELERVFDRFYRPPNDATSGTGLGLSIVRAITQSIGGRAWLEKRGEGPGLTVTLEFPMAPGVG